MRLEQWFLVGNVGLPLSWFAAEEENERKTWRRRVKLKDPLLEIIVLLFLSFVFKSSDV